MDSDGDTDILSASYNDDKIAWYENDGSEGFTTHTMATDADGASDVLAADVDSDGDLDILSTSITDDKVAWYENQGGHFALSTTDTAPANINDGAQDDLLSIVAHHRGRSGNHSVELASFELRFEDNSGTALSTVQAQALVENLHIYLDTGSDTFSEDSDTLVTTIPNANFSLTDGVQSFTLPDGDGNVQYAHATTKRYFVVVEATSQGSQKTPNQFQLIHLTSASSMAEDPTNDSPLTLEYAANVPSSIVSIAESDPTALTIGDFESSNAESQPIAWLMAALMTLLTTAGVAWRRVWRHE